MDKIPLLTSVKDMFSCSSCHDVCTERTHLGCRHMFCLTSVKEELSKTRKCPKCNYLVNPKERRRRDVEVLQQLVNDWISSFKDELSESSRITSPVVSCSQVQNTQKRKFFKSKENQIIPSIVSNCLEPDAIDYETRESCSQEMNTIVDETREQESCSQESNTIYDEGRENCSQDMDTIDDIDSNSEFETTPNYIWRVENEVNTCPTEKSKTTSFEAELAESTTVKSSVVPCSQVQNTQKRKFFISNEIPTTPSIVSNCSQEMDTIDDIDSDSEFEPTPNFIWRDENEVNTCTIEKSKTESNNISNRVLGTATELRYCNSSSSETIKAGSQCVANTDIESDTDSSSYVEKLKLANNLMMQVGCKPLF